jgi:hypothetical protein
LGAEDARRPRGKFSQIFDKTGAFGLPPLDPARIVRYLVTPMDRRSEVLDGTRENSDGTVRSGAKTDRSSQDHRHRNLKYPML